VEEERRIRRLETYGDISGRGKKNKTHGDIWVAMGIFWEEDGVLGTYGDIWEDDEDLY